MRWNCLLTALALLATVPACTTDTSLGKDPRRDANAEVRPDAITPSPDDTGGASPADTASPSTADTASPPTDTTSLVKNDAAPPTPDLAPEVNRDAIGAGDTINADAAKDAGPDTVPACTPGADQTCNDDLLMSSLAGTCQADGTCRCRADAVVNPATGRCRVPAMVRDAAADGREVETDGGAGMCSGSYLACGCGCCTGVSTMAVCYYPSAGDSLAPIIAADQATATSETCKSAGCSRGQQYLCCVELPPETGGSATYTAVFHATAVDRFSVIKTEPSGLTTTLTFVRDSMLTAGFKVTAPGDWVVQNGVQAQLEVRTGMAIGGQGSVTFSPDGDTCVVNAHFTLFLSADNLNVTAVRFDADGIPSGDMGSPAACQ